MGVQFVYIIHMCKHAVHIIMYVMEMEIVNKCKRESCNRVTPFVYPIPAYNINISILRVTRSLIEIKNSKRDGHLAIYVHTI